MEQQLYVGVDGGATKSIIRLEDAEGRLLGQAWCGPANIRISVEQTWEAILTGLNEILHKNSINFEQNRHRLHVGMGLAGSEVTAAYDAFIAQAPGFKTFIVTSDAHIACLGAHGGKDGGVIIAGTGAVGYQIEGQVTTKVGGWGFPYDDDGSGAWLGLHALKMTLQWLDGRLSSSPLVRAIYDHFNQDRNKMIDWAMHANSTAFAALAPILIKQHQLGDQTATRLLKEAAGAIDRIWQVMYKAQQTEEKALRYALIGGIAPFLVPYLAQPLRDHLHPCEAMPDKGAILLVRQHLSNIAQSRPEYTIKTKASP